ncbi:MAG TPA: PQ-loop domain-containing transporter [Desulfosporosinus sp.]|nr:PQ-loop domain-containing transporter [Desulfosporosinus sp.]
MSIFEIIMLICFGAAWPLSIYKSYTSRSTEGKSVSFLFVILIGYVAGIFYKIFDQYDSVVYLYLLNCIMVLTDLLIYYRNRRIVANSSDPCNATTSRPPVSAR